MSNSEGNRQILRRLFEVGGWILLVGVLWGSDLMAKLNERNQEGFGKDIFKLISEQVTSALAVLIMILFVIQWLKLFPLMRGNWLRTILGHVAGSVIFAFGHYALMVAMRFAWYALNGANYIWREPFVANLFVEYQKDIKVYFGVIVIASAYSLYRQEPTTKPTDSGKPEQSADRMVVQTGQGISVLNFKQIDYLEAARNYVSVHAESREYVIRDTISNLLKKLPDDRFARTHRSFVVNLDKIGEIRTQDSKSFVLLKSGDQVPLSRSFRDEFKNKIIN